MIHHFIIIFTLFLISTNLDGAELQVSAPKGVKDAFVEISDFFEKNNPEWEVKLRTGKSGELGRLIAQSSNTDVFMLSDEKTVQDLQKKKHIKNVRRFLAEDLVVIGAATSKLEISDPAKLVFPELKGVALMGEKSAVGKTAHAYLKKINLLDSIMPKVSPKKNPKEVIKGIIAGEADWGIVRASDAVRAKGVKVLWKVPETSEIYYIGTVTKSQHQKGALLYLEALNSTIARKIFENQGLRLLQN